MLHSLYFITRKPAISEEEFHRCWREVHGPIARQIPQLEHYKQSHRVPFAGATSDYDGVAKVWLEDEAAMDALRCSPEYLDGALANEPNFINMNRAGWLVTQDRVILDGPQITSQAKTISRVKRKAGMSLKDSRTYWAEAHSPLACKLPGIQRYVQCLTVDTAYAYAEPRLDEVSQIWVENLVALQRLREAEEYTVGTSSDAAKVLDGESVASFAAQEHHAIRPE